MLPVARRYARALLDVALEAGQAEPVRRELRDAVALIAAHGELAATLAHPALPADRKKKIVEGVWKGRTSELTLRLLLLLVAHGRLGLLSRIEEIFSTLWNRRRNVVSAEVVSAVALDPAQSEAVARAIRTLTGKDAELVQRVDPGLLGGVRVGLEGRVYDGSVRAQLRALKERLVKGAA